MALSVAILGSGNIAFHLLRAFDQSGIKLSGLISRDLERGRQTLEESKARCELVGALHLGELEADVIVLAIPENQIAKVLKFYEFSPDHVVVHTSGAEPMSSLPLEHAGVFYPLQTFTWGETMDYSEIPILIEGSNLSVEEKLFELGNAVSRKVKLISSDDRLRIHLAAVLACNFTNHLFRKSEEVLESMDESLRLLRPLIVETIKKSMTLGPAKAQTGPAIRDDQETMARHMELIDDSHLREIYQLISADIGRSNG